MIGEAVMVVVVVLDVAVTGLTRRSFDYDKIFSNFQLAFVHMKYWGVLTAWVLAVRVGRRPSRLEPCSAERAREVAPFHAA